MRKTRYSAFTLSVLVAWASMGSAHAIGFGSPLIQVEGPKGPAFFSLPLFRGTKDYQIGSEWGKKVVGAGDLEKSDPIFKRLAFATARYGTATAFYLGMFNGQHVMATNYHVAEAYGCKSTANMLMLGKKYPCKKLFGMWTDIDFALFAIEVPAKDEASLKAVGQNFAFNLSIFPGQEIFTMGFCVAGNNGQKDLMVNQDSDCKVFSSRDEFRFMGAPDEFNPGPYKSWSFANGCDVSHGDSGSSFVDRKSGEIMGLVWTGRIPKSAKIQDSRYLDQLIKNQGDDIWAELTYSVPAIKIREHLRKVIADPKLDELTRKTIGEVIN